MVIGYSSADSFFNSPYISTLFSLDEFLVGGAAFTVQDDLFSMETQNYPVWGGERLVHDPSLSIYYERVSSGETPTTPQEAIPSYNIAILIGLIGVVMSVITIRLRKK